MNIPYCFVPWKVLRRGSTAFYWLAEFIARSKPEVELELKKIDFGMKAKNYIAAALFSDLFFFLFFVAFTLPIFIKYKAPYPILISFAVGILISGFIFMQQLIYPKTILNKKIKSIEKHLLPALSTMKVQVSSGIPIYNIISAISTENYGGISQEFKKALRQINAGMHQVNVFEKMATENPSIYFQRIMWQIVTAMKSGSDLENVLSRIISSLSEEQLVSVQSYGSSLNPMTMFYMLMVVIAPALAITFFVVLSSFLSMAESAMKGLFWGMYSVVILFQLFFMTMIASRRPNLL